MFPEGPTFTGESHVPGGSGRSTGLLWSVWEDGGVELNDGHQNHTILSILL